MVRVVSGHDDHSSTASQRLQELQVHRAARGRWVLQVGDEIRTCAERDLPEALRQALGLGMQDAIALATTLRSDARDA
jgi:hypothetical protein